MTRVTFLGAAALALGIMPQALIAQQPQASQPFVVGNPLGLPVIPSANGTFEPISSFTMSPG